MDEDEDEGEEGDMAAEEGDANEEMVEFEYDSVQGFFAHKGARQQTAYSMLD
jgi:hypothetical protein